MERIAGPGAADLLRLARQVQVGAGAPGTISGASQNANHFSRSTTSGVNCDAERAQRRHLLLAQAPVTGGHFEFGREIAAQRNPCAAGLTRCKFGDHGLAVDNGEGRAQFLAARTRPRKAQARRRAFQP